MARQARPGVLLNKETILAEADPARLSATQLLDRVETSIQANHHEEAKNWLQEFSNRKLPTPSEEAYRYHYLRGLILFWQGDQTAAWKEAEEALQIFRQLHRPLALPEQDNLPNFVIENLKQLREIELALLEGLEGESLDVEKKEKDALEKRILEISASLKNLNPLAKLHQLAGSIVMHLGKLNEAFEHLERAATGFRLSRDWAALAQTLNRIAQLYHIRGELSEAIHMLEQARNYSRKAKDRYFEMVLRSNAVFCQLLLGMWRPALSTLPEILAEAKKAGDLPRYANTLLIWGYALLLQGRLKETRRAFLKAQTICAEKKLVGGLTSSYGFLADLFLTEGRLDEAEECLKKVLELAPQTAPKGGPEAEAWERLGELFLARKQYKKALENFGLCQNHLSDPPEKLVQGALHRGMGACHIRMEQFRVARKEFNQAIEIFESCGNDWELAKTVVTAAEAGAFAPAEVRPKIVWAKEIFKKLEHPAWRKKAQNLLELSDFTSPGTPLRTAHELVEKELIAKALAETDGNVSAAAKKLGLLRQTLQYKIKRYKIAV